ncbi:MAG: family 16 glycosylhydrolase [Kiritimatiellales bacterium]
MRKIMIRTVAGGVLSMLITGSVHAVEMPQPVLNTGDNRQWELLNDFSDEFNAVQLDEQKWHNDESDWGTWSWNPDNVYLQNGSLHIRMAYDPHLRDGQQIFYKSGIVQSKQRIHYGFFEARLKGASVFPGVCPAFWIKGSGDPEDSRMKGTEGRASSEVDFVELQEAPGDIHQIDCNLHAAVEMDGKLQWVRRRQHWVAPWDPRDDYHIYGCEVNETSITWYIDGEKVLTTANDHWHFPSYVMLSMGLRPPYQVWGSPSKFGEGQKTRPNPDTSTPNGFPTEMCVDYVRVWTQAK